MRGLYSSCLIRYSQSQSESSLTGASSSPSTAMMAPRLSLADGLGELGSLYGGVMRPSSLILFEYGKVLSISSTVRGLASRRMEPSSTMEDLRASRGVRGGAIPALFGGEFRTWIGGSGLGLDCRRLYCG